MERSKYNLVQENGQRKYGGPPADWEGPPPLKGSEVFVGKLPRDCYEEELIPVFEKPGVIYEMRLMMDFNGCNRGYAFVMYSNPKEAKKAVLELNNYEIRKGRYLGVVRSVDNCRLFVGGLPKTKLKGDIMQEMSKISEGVVDVILYSSVQDKNKNRGFAFVEYESHRSAAMARRKLIQGRIQLWGHEIAVDWAEPEPEVDDEVMSKVTVLYVRNLMLSTSEDTIKQAFNNVADNSVEKVKKLRDFAFVHFPNREKAQLGLEHLNKTELDGSIIEVTWAKPVDKDVYRMQKQMSRRPDLNGANGANATYDVYGWNPFSGCSTVIRTTPRQRGRGAAGWRGGRGYSARFSSVVRSMGYPSHAMEALKNTCMKYNWGEPNYHVMTTYRGREQGADPLYSCKVTIPRYPGNTNVFQPHKFASNPEEAKVIAADSVLNQIMPRNDGYEGAAAVVTTGPVYQQPPPPIAVNSSPTYHVTNALHPRPDMSIAYALPPPHPSGPYLFPGKVPQYDHYYEGQGPYAVSTVPAPTMY